MALNKARLVTRAELLRRIDRSRTRFYVDACPTGILRNAIAPDGRIDLSHIDAVNYCHEHNYQEPNVKDEVAKALKAERQKATAPKAPPTTATSFENTAEIMWGKETTAALKAGIVTPDQSADAAAEEYDDNDEKTAEDFMGMTLAELVHRFGTQARFYDYARARKTLTDIQAKDEDAARRRGEHVPFSIVLALQGHIDALQTALLSETTVALRTKMTALIKSGADEKTIERSVHDMISRTIKTAKGTTERIIRDVQRK